MTQVATKPSNRKNTDSSGIEYPLVYEVSKRGKSSWTPKDKSRHTTINTAKNFFLDVRSKTKIEGRVGEVEIQYVPGAPTIFVNDWKEGGVEYKGLKSLGYDLKGDDYRRAKEENIRFVNGILYLENYGGQGNVTLCQFMHHHGMNEGAPGYKRNPRMQSMFLFKPLVKEKKAVASLDSLEVEQIAINLFAGLRKKAGDTFEYDTAKIDAILGMLNEGGGLQDNESSEKMLLIKPFVYAGAAKFMKLYEDTINEYKMVINMATTLKVLTIGEKKAEVKIRQIQPIVIELNNESREANIEALIFHFLGTEMGKITYSQLVGEVEAKKIEALAN